ncbi:MAG: polysaccharide biosynthesis C-terminal domain-containing protein, partial [Clostridia bacterium]|nr:polysaccharide biosynthesis C-terminal domain-containing protein [Clostridia bacterium]
AASISVDSLANAIRCVAVCLLIVPFLSIFRGFLQGQKVLAVSAFSQVVEQVARIGFVLIGAYIAIKVFGFSTSTGVNIALLGAGIGAFCAILYLVLKSRGADDVIVKNSYEQDIPSTKEILKKFLFHCIPILIVAVSANIYEMTNNLLVVGFYADLRFDNADKIGSVITTYGPKIAMIISALAMGLTSTIVPEMTALVAKRDLRQANKKLNSAIDIIFAISLPICVGMVVLSDSVYAFFYGNNMSDVGSMMIKFIIPVNVVSCLKITLCMAMQGLKKTKAVCIATISGILINLVLAVPLMWLCYYVFGFGLHSYIGACISTFIGQSTCVVIILIVLRKSFNFRYGSIFRTFIKTAVPAAIMGAVVFIINYFFPVSSTRSVSMIVHLCAYAAIGAIIYFVIFYLNGGLYLVFGKDMIDNILRKLRIKR